MRVCNCENCQYYERCCRDEESVFETDLAEECIDYDPVDDDDEDSEIIRAYIEESKEEYRMYYQMLIDEEEM